MGEPPQKIFKGQKHAKFGPISVDFKVWRPISLERMKIFKIGKLLVGHRFLPRRWNKSGEVRSSDLGDLDVELNPPKAHFSENHISAPRGCCAPKFLHALENDQVLLAHFPPGTGAPLTTFFKEGSKIGLKCNKWALITWKLGGVAQRNFGTWRGFRLGC